MKKISFTVALIALILMSCNDVKKGYIINGTIAGAKDGEMVHLQVRGEDRQFRNLDSALVKNEKFTFKGVQDSVAIRYLMFTINNIYSRTDFFLENGEINAEIHPLQSIFGGTPANEAYQIFNEKIYAINKQESELTKLISDPTITDEQKAAKHKELEALGEQTIAVYKEEIEKNITNAVGITLLAQYNFYMEYPELEVLLAKVPDKFRNNPHIIRLTHLTEVAKTTAAGQKFVDFEMKTPEGKRMKLSDHAGKGKVVLVDFWASWCGPCRRETPNLVEAYKKYKSKGFEIVGVSLDSKEDAWKAGIMQLNMTWPHMSDLNYWKSEGAGLYAVRSIPYTVLIDKNGTIIAKGLHGEELQKKLAEIF